MSKKEYTKEGYHEHKGKTGRYVKKDIRPDGKPARKSSEGETIDYQPKEKK